MTPHSDTVRRPAALALAACAAFAAGGVLSACAHDAGYRGGTYTSFTFRPPTSGGIAPAATIAPNRPGSVPPADLARWIANDEAALRGASRTSSNAYGTHLASLLNGLWLAHRDRALAQHLATIGTRVAGASDERTDLRFFHGDHGAAFDASAARIAELREARELARASRWLDAIHSVRGVRETAHPDGRSIDAALLEGDAYAACGLYADARTTWYRAFSTAVLQPRDHYRFFPAWTSAMRRLVRYRARADRPQPIPNCRALPPPILDPVS